MRYKDALERLLTAADGAVQGLYDEYADVAQSTPIAHLIIEEVYDSTVQYGHEDDDEVDFDEVRRAATAGLADLADLFSEACARVAAASAD